MSSVNQCPQQSGSEDVTDGCVDNYDTDWVADNVYPEDEMRPNNGWCSSDDSPCGGSQKPTCGQNRPDQTDDEAYEIKDE
jgi:hypothetical protein